MTLSQAADWLDAGAMSAAPTPECLWLLDRQDGVIAVGQAVSAGMSDKSVRGKLAGIVIHRSRSLDRIRHPVLTPPRTRVEETVLDLIDGSGDFDEAYHWVCRAIGRRRTTAGRIRATLAARSRIRWRQEIELALGYARAGALSVLELRYVRGVERRHGLPTASRQARVRHATGNQYLDNLYVEYRACVEIDGTAAHPADEQWRDKSRDRWHAAHEGIDTIRIGVADLVSQERQCRTAADVAHWLSGRGPKVGHACGPGCPVGLPVVVPTIYGW